MAKERNRATPASYLILKHEGKILLMLRKNSGYYDGYYSVPAGHVEAGELPVGALVREVKEEVGIDIPADAVSLAHVMYRTKHDETGDRIDYFFTTDTYTGEIVNAEPHKCDEVEWFALAELPENTVHHVRRALESVEKGGRYSELSVDEIVKNPNTA